MTEAFLLRLLEELDRRIQTGTAQSDWLTRRKKLGMQTLLARGWVHNSKPALTTAGREILQKHLEPGPPSNGRRHRQRKDKPPPKRHKEPA